MYFIGVDKVYDFSKPDPNTGAPLELEDSTSLYYHVNDEFMDGGDTVVNFYIVQVSGLDTQIINSSPLVVNGSGMFFWYKPDKEDQFFEGTSKKEMKQGRKGRLQQVVRTPLSMDSHWESIDQASQQGVFACAAIDTLLKTPAGDFHAFGVRSESVSEDNKNYRITVVVTEYYAQGTGKIQSLTSSYVYLKNSGETRKFFDSIVSVARYWRE